MTKEVNNKSLTKPLALSAGVIGLIEGLVWSILSLLGISCYTGAIEVDTTSVTSVINAKENAVDANVLIKPREFLIFMWFYAIFSIIWFLVSCTVIWSIIHNQWHLLKYVFGAWSMLAILVSIVDVILTSLIAADYNKLDNIFSVILVCYGIMMTLAARGYILWLINVIFACIMCKFVINDIQNDSKDTTMPIIHGYEAETNPPWFKDSSKDIMENSPRNRENIYQNQGFERSQSFYPLPGAENEYREPRDSFGASIANKVATIGKNRGTRSPPNNVRAPVVPPISNGGPVIPLPDYTPPGSPKSGLKSVLRSRSNY